MDSVDVYAIAGLIVGLIGLAMIIAGFIILIRSIISTIKKKKRIGGIVGGALLIAFSLVAFYAAMVLMLLNGIAMS